MAAFVSTHHSYVKTEFAADNFIFQHHNVLCKKSIAHFMRFNKTALKTPTKILLHILCRKGPCDIRA